MMPLAQEDFVIQEAEGSTIETLLVDALASYIEMHRDVIEVGGTIRFSFLPNRITEKRAGKQEIDEMLKVLSDVHKKSGGSCLWKEDAYVFDFEKRVYTMDGAPIHLTAMEQLVLFRVLVEKLDVTIVPRLAQVRQGLYRRFDKEFLAGYL